MPSYIAAMLRISDENHITCGDDIIKTITPLGYAGTAKYYAEVLGVPLAEALFKHPNWGAFLLLYIAKFFRKLGY